MDRGRPVAPAAPQPAKQPERAERILDAAAALLVRWGYPRVTIDDIASEADIGKGTVYLHWRSREALFQALLLRETVAVWREILARVRADPAEALVSRMLRSLLLITMRRPLARALFTGDREVLGKLARSDVGRAAPSQQAIASREFLASLRDLGLVRADAEPVVQGYALRATVGGFFLAEASLTGEDEPALEARAEALARTVRDAFEPAILPPPTELHDAALGLISRLERLCATYERQMGELSDPARSAPAP